LRVVVEAAPCALVLIGAAGRIALVNAEAERLFGHPRAELLGRSVEMLVPERRRRIHGRLYARFLRRPWARRLGAGRALLALRSDGAEFPIEVALSPVEAEDGGPMILAAIADASAGRRREAALRSALREKDRRLGAIHHRVGNDLQVIESLLALQAARAPDPAAAQALVESQNRVRTMALVHRTLAKSEDRTRVDFRVLLDSLATGLMKSQAPHEGRPTLAIEAAEVALPIEQAVPAGLLVNELLSNALRHAFPDGRRGGVRIGLDRVAEEEVVVSVSDDGIGLPEALDCADARTLGLQLVGLLADQLAARVAIERGDPTRFSVQFKVAR
jgi:PAS domain S-box-containing protein